MTDIPVITSRPDAGTTLRTFIRRSFDLLSFTEAMSNVWTAAGFELSCARAKCMAKRTTNSVDSKGSSRRTRLKSIVVIIGRNQNRLVEIIEHDSKDFCPCPTSEFSETFCNQVWRWERVWLFPCDRFAITSRRCEAEA